MNFKTISFASAFCLALGLVVGTSLAADEYNIDKTHSSIGFSVTHLVISKVKGTFGDFAGAITYDENDIGNSSVEVHIKTTSIDTKDEKRDAHLRSADFFDVETFPEIIFKSKSVAKADDGYIVVGDLTMRGVTKEVTIPFTISGMITDQSGNKRLGASAELTLDRQDYGVSWSKKLDGGGLVVGDDVKIEIEIEAIKAE